MQKDYQLDSAVSKATGPVALWDSDRGLLDIKKDTLAVVVRTDGRQTGFIFHGSARLLIDAIIETEEGAMGKSVERELPEPFLMLQGMNGIERQFAPADNDDLKRMGYENGSMFVDKAKELLNKFVGNGRVHTTQCPVDHDEMVFAFPGEVGSLDILALNGSKLVYTSKSMIFVADGDKTVLKASDKVIVSSSGRAFVVNAHCVPFLH